MTRPLRIVISAGEASGDRLGAGLALALRQLRPDVELLGMGGEAMAGAGVRLVQDASEVAVVGIFEVLARLPAIRRAMGRLEAVLERERPDLLVPVDFPDFNVRLAAASARAKVPVVYFVSPQIWAWRRGRVRKIRRRVRRMLVLFPFETTFYEQAGVPVTFVGHPLADEPRQPFSRRELLDRAGLSGEAPVIALLPGSRSVEVARLLPPMLGAAELLRARFPDLRFVIPRATTLPRERLEAPLLRSAIAGSVSVLDADYPAILEACSAGVVASGTATLDAALAGLPMVVVYRMGALSYLLARSLVRVDHVALPNLVAGRRLVPELIQAACTPSRIAAVLEGYLGDPQATVRLRADLVSIRKRLGGPGAYLRAAEAVLAEADRRREGTGSGARIP